VYRNATAAIPENTEEPSPWVPDFPGLLKAFSPALTDSEKEQEGSDEK
jgi:hypothetical protein